MELFFYLFLYTFEVTRFYFMKPIHSIVFLTPVRPLIFMGLELSLIQLTLIRTICKTST